MALESSLLVRAKSSREVKEANVIQNQQNNHGNKTSVVYNNLDSSVKRLIKNVNDKAKRKSNVVIFIILDFNSFNDDKHSLSNLTFDLTENEIVSISRLPSNSHRPLKLQLRNKRCDSNYLEAAKQPRLMKFAWPKIGVSSDQSPYKVRSHQIVTKQLKHGHSIDEQVRFDGD